jgi:hypothetical protein
MKRSVFNIFTLVLLVIAIFSGYALVASIKSGSELGLAFHFWLEFHIISGSVTVLLLILQIVINRSFIFNFLKKMAKSLSVDRDSGLTVRG